MKRLTAVLMTAGLLACVAAATAGAAASPLKGTWECTYPESDRLFGLITFVDAKTYKWNKGKKGRYALSGGKKIAFKSGPMKGVFEHAELRRGAAGNRWINLFDGAEYGHSYTDAQCLKRKS